MVGVAGTALVSLLTEPEEIVGAFRLAEKREAACQGGMRQNSHCVESMLDLRERASAETEAVTGARKPFCQVSLIKGVLKTRRLSQSDNVLSVSSSCLPE